MHQFTFSKVHSFRLKRALFDQMMLLRRLEEEQSILVKEMSQHITSLRKEIKGVEKLTENIRMGCKSISDPPPFPHTHTQCIFPFVLTRTISTCLTLLGFRHLVFHCKKVPFNVSGCYSDTEGNYHSISHTTPLHYHTLFPLSSPQSIPHCTHSHSY